MRSDAFVAAVGASNSENGAKFEEEIGGGAGSNLLEKEPDSTGVPRKDGDSSCHQKSPLLSENGCEEITAKDGE